MAEEDIRKIAALDGRIEALTSQIETSKDEKDASDEEMEGLKEELKTANEQLEAYENEGKTVEEQHEIELKKKDDEIVKSRAETKEKDDIIKQKDKDALRQKVLSEYPDIDPSWIRGDTEEELKKSAEEAKTRIEDIIKKRLEEKVGKEPKWDTVPGPGSGGGGGGPVAPEDLETVKKQLEEEKAKGAQGDVAKIVDLKFKLGKIQLRQK